MEGNAGAPKADGVALRHGPGRPHPVRRVLVALVCAGALVPVVGFSGAVAASADDHDPALVAHVVNRLAFGPRPGDLERVEKEGVDAYIDEQLHPERIPLSPELTDQLAQLRLANSTPADLIVQFRELQKNVKAEGQAGKDERREWVQDYVTQSATARLAQAVDSPRQLEEVMVDFWFNHFNVFAGKGLDRVLVADYERTVIRPYALGRFRDLLGASAHHAAMLFYLDNWLSAAPGYQPPGGRGNGAVNGLNENYARELMELHTLGVDGGYTQKDVTELARILTGWTIAPPRRATSPSGFYFDDKRHDWGTKNWLNYTVAPRGEAEGEWALDVLARHPATAHHISYELAQYFVSDHPPEALVARMAQRFTETDGDIRAVLKVLFSSREFRDPANQGTKFKTPYQYVVSALRATGTPVVNVRPILGVLNQMGEPLYGCVTPDGYANTQDAWLNPDAMTRRLNVATALASGRLPAGRPPATEAGGDAMAAGAARARPALFAARPIPVDDLLDTLGDSIGASTLKALASADPPLRSAMVLGSPDFMHR